MRVRTLIRFSDLNANKVREVGDEFEVTNVRLNEINSASNSVLVEVIKEKKATKPRATKKK